MAAFRATTWRYAMACQSVSLTVFEVTQGYQLLFVQSGRRERRTFQTVDGALTAQAEWERTLVAQGFLLAEFNAERRHVMANQRAFTRPKSFRGKLLMEGTVIAAISVLLMIIAWQRP